MSPWADGLSNTETAAGFAAAMWTARLEALGAVLGHKGCAYFPEMKKKRIKSVLYSKQNTKQSITAKDGRCVDKYNEVWGQMVYTTDRHSPEFFLHSFVKNGLKRRGDCAVGKVQPAFTIELGSNRRPHARLRAMPRVFQCLRNGMGVGGSADFEQTTLWAFEHIYW